MFTSLRKYSYLCFSIAIQLCAIILLKMIFLCLRYFQVGFLHIYQPSIRNDLVLSVSQSKLSLPSTLIFLDFFLYLAGLG